jgi:toxin-antitoxin system PIN domain toxin
MTPDVNVLVAASRSDHPHHRPALAWLEEALDGSQRGRTLTLLPMVAAGFLRLVTHPKVFVQPTPVEAALAFLRAMLDTPGVEMAALGTEWPLFDRLCEQYQLTGNDIPDAWIVAAVQANHFHLVSFDKGFQRFLKNGEFTLLRPES